MLVPAPLVVFLPDILGVLGSWGKGQVKCMRAAVYTMIFLLHSNLNNSNYRGAWGAISCDTQETGCHVK